jgi:hypothetical protein
VGTTAAALLAELRGQGFTLAAAGQELRVKPARRITPEQRAQIRALRGELLDLVAQEGRQPDRPAAWPADAEVVEKLFAWFRGFTPPQEPFALGGPHRVVSDPELWCQTLADDIARGPGGPHVHAAVGGWGCCVIDDLLALYRLFGPRRPTPADGGGS